MLLVHNYKDKYKGIITQADYIKFGGSIANPTVVEAFKGNTQNILQTRPFRFKQISPEKKTPSKPKSPTSRTTVTSTTTTTNNKDNNNSTTTHTSGRSRQYAVCCVIPDRIRPPPLL